MRHRFVDVQECRLVGGNRLARSHCLLVQRGRRGWGRESRGRGRLGSRPRSVRAPARGQSGYGNHQTDNPAVPNSEGHSQTSHQRTSVASHSSRLAWRIVGATTAGPLPPDQSVDDRRDRGRSHDEPLMSPSTDRVSTRQPRAVPKQQSSGTSAASMRRWSVARRRSAILPFTGKSPPPRAAVKEE